MHNSYIPLTTDSPSDEEAVGHEAVAVLDDITTLDTTPKAAYKCHTWSKSLPRTSYHRLSQSTEKSSKIDDAIERPGDPEKTVLYLAYGSNLSAETFQGKRGIRPLSAITVLVPSLSLTFDLPGVPYTEPCFANTAYRTPPPAELSDKARLLPGTTSTSEDAPHNPPPFPHGLVGVVYEVTPADYAHIIATEGGGASYHDVLVKCHSLPPSSPTVPAHPDTPAFPAHTLFAPLKKLSRPHPDYAQASPRYLKLLKDGADEHSFPDDYKKYLASLEGYRITSQRQQMGQFIFLAIWWPIVMFLFGLGKIYKDGEGRSPPWLVWMLESVFTGMWKFYDGWFKYVFGDGERTVEGDGGRGRKFAKSQTLLGEKSVLDISKNALDKKVGDAVDMA